MGDDMLWTTPYHLPYTVLHPESRLLFSLQSNVIVQLYLRGRNRIDGDVVSDAGSLLVVLYELALSGALSGSQIPPWLSSLEDFEENVLEDSIRWTLQKCNMDERTLIMLAQSFLLVHESYPIEKLVFRPAEQDLNLSELTNNKDENKIYPDIYTPLDFELVNNLRSSSVAVITVRFEREPSDEDKEGIDIEISTWLAAGEIGMYAVHPLSPADCTFTSNDDLFFNDVSLEFSLSRYRANPAAVNGFVNICSAMNRRITKIKRVVIE